MCNGLAMSSNDNSLTILCVLEKLQQFVIGFRRMHITHWPILFGILIHISPLQASPYQSTSPSAARAFFAMMAYSPSTSLLRRTVGLDVSR